MLAVQLRVQSNDLEQSLATVVLAQILSSWAWMAITAIDMSRKKCSKLSLAMAAKEILGTDCLLLADSCRLMFTARRTDHVFSEALASACVSTYSRMCFTLPLWTVTAKTK